VTVGWNIDGVRTLSATLEECKESGKWAKILY
jgi:hypothetical protein